MSSFRFQILARDPHSLARAGILHTPHGPIPTPAFLPVGTQATVKGCPPEMLKALGVSVVMSNAYHLALRPGVEAVKALGGLHALAGWDGPMMTDSGGFQVFSLAHRRKLDLDGVDFRSHLDGSLLRFTPESLMALQAGLGADLIMPLDVCSAGGADRVTAEGEMRLTLAWAARAIAAERRGDQLLYGIVQGAAHPDLRVASAQATRALGFQAYAIGGLSVGESKVATLAALDAAVVELPDEAPRHLLGVGHPEDFVTGVLRGMDSFDCVMPTRVARTGGALTWGGRVNMRNAVHAQDPAPLDAHCACPTCRRFSRGAIRHFLKAGEMLGAILLTVHNLHFMLRLMDDLRQAILDGRLSEVREQLAERLGGGLHADLIRRAPPVLAG
ncbi:MAG: tRNA guanosine(34) transglycosylase Tgt [Anaerolineae bacterium]